jgi:centrosomal protein CEP41
VNAMARRRGELFFRMTPAQVSRLISKQLSEESIFDLGKENIANFGESSTASFYSEAASVASSMITTVTAEEQKPSQADFIILDVRDREDYVSYRIQDAVHCPLQMLGTARINSQLYPYKSTPG